MNLSSGYIQGQVECIRRAEIRSRLVAMRPPAQCPSRTKEEGTITSDVPYNSIYIANKSVQCPIVSNISPGAVPAGIYLRAKQLSCEEVLQKPLQTIRLPAPVPCAPLPPETRNAGVPVHTPLLRCVPQIIGFT